MKPGTKNDLGCPFLSQLLRKVICLLKSSSQEESLPVPQLLGTRFSRNDLMSSSWTVVV